MKETLQTVLLTERKISFPFAASREKFSSSEDGLSLASREKCCTFAS